MSKSPDAFRTISEVAEWLGIQAHVLRFWESKFTQVKPVKRAGGRRYYRPADMLLIGGIKKLLHDDGMTIKGVQNILREQGVAHVSSFSRALDDHSGVESDSAPASAAPEDADEVVVPFSPASEDLQTQFDLDLIADTVDIQDAPDEPEVEDAPSPLFGDDVSGEPDAVEAVTDAEAPLPVEVTAEPEIAPETMEAEAEEAPAIEAAPAPVPAQVDVLDPPEDTQVTCDPGPLSHLAKLSRIDPELRDELAALADELRQISAGSEKAI